MYVNRVYLFRGIASNIALDVPSPFRTPQGTPHDQGCKPKTESRFIGRFFSVAQKTETEKPTQFFSVVFFSCPLYNNRLQIYMETPLWMDTWTASAHSSISSAAAAAVYGCCCWRGQTQHVNLLLIQSLQYYRQVHNPLMFHSWFPCTLILSVTPLPKMNSELTSLMRSMGLFFVFGVYYV